MTATNSKQPAAKVKVAIIGSGNIGTDLMIKILRTATELEMCVLVGIDPESDGLARARRMGVIACDSGIEGLVQLPEFNDIQIVFDATSAYAHQHHYQILKAYGKTIIDLTPAAIGPYVVPVVNLQQHLACDNINMVTCGGQATIPIVAAVSQVSPVIYAEIIASVSSRSAGPGTRANIDEFTQTTARAIEQVAGARLAKAIIVLNPAEPPMMMRDTVFTLSEDLANPEATEAAITQAVADMVAKVQQYVPGYRMKQQVQFERFSADKPLLIPGVGQFSGIKSTILLEVEGAAHYLPAYAGNLDIMTSAALGTAQSIARGRLPSAQENNL